MLPATYEIKANITEYAPFDEGVYQAVLEDIEDKGLVQTPWGDKLQMVFKFFIPSLSRNIFYTAANSWSTGGRYKPSSLYILCQAMGYKDSAKPSVEELNGLVTKPVTLVIKNKLNTKGEMRSRITDFLTAK